MEGDRPIILFDGVCNLCNSSVQFVIRHDRNKKFRFASLQGKSGKDLLEKAGLLLNDFHSFVLIDGKKMYTHSSAALRVARILGGGWSLLYGMVIVPRFIRDAVYRLIARNRYRWFGRREACMIPSPEMKDRFLPD